MKTKLSILSLLIFTVHITWAQDFRYGRVSKEELQEQQHPTDPEANAAVLYREITSTFHYDQSTGFYMVTEVFERVKLYKREGFDWGTKEVNLFKSGNSKDTFSRLRAVTYSLDDNGRIKEERLRNDGIFEIEHNEYRSQTKFTMPNLKEGAVIEYRYLVRSPFISNIDEFIFQETIPVNKVKIKFSHPDWYTFQTHHKGWIPFRVNTDATTNSLAYNQRSENPGDPFSRGHAGSGTSIQNVSYKEIINTVTMDNVPALKLESYAGNIRNYSSGLKFELSYFQYPGGMMNTYTTTWDAVAKGIYDSNSFGRELERAGYFKSDVDALLSGVSNPQEKASKIFDFLKDKMTWNSIRGYYTNEGVRDAYKKGSGNSADINLALVAMLRYAGLEANPVLVSTKGHGIPLFPTRNGFNYVVAGLEMNNEVLLMDATNKHSEIGVLHPDLLNWHGRLIRRDQSSFWVNLYPSSHAASDAMVAMQFSDNLKLTGNVKSRMSGHYALQYRDSYSKLSSEAQYKEFEKQLGKAEISELGFENLAVANQPVSLQYDFETSDMLDEIAGKIYFSPLSFLAMQESPFKLEAREYPIDFGYPMRNRYMVTIDIPEGYVVESIPENVQVMLGKDMGHFRYLISDIGGKLQLSVELTINDAVIAAEDYGDVKKLFEMAVSKQVEKVVLVKA